MIKQSNPNPAHPKPVTLLRSLSSDFMMYFIELGKVEFRRNREAGVPRLADHIRRQAARLS